MNLSLFKIIIIFFLILPLEGMFFYFGRNISYLEQLKMIESVRNVSSIIFAISGIWIARIYPECLEILSEEKVNFSRSDKASRNFYNLIFLMFISCIIIIFSLFFQLFTPVFKQQSFIIDNYKIFRGLSYSFISIFTFIQFSMLIYVIYPGKVLYESINKKNNLANTKSQMMPNYKDTKKDEHDLG